MLPRDPTNVSLLSPDCHPKHPFSASYSSAVALCRWRAASGNLCGFRYANPPRPPLRDPLDFSRVMTRCMYMTRWGYSRFQNSFGLSSVVERWVFTKRWVSSSLQNLFDLRGELGVSADPMLVGAQITTSAQWKPRVYSRAVSFQGIQSSSLLRCI